MGLNLPDPAIFESYDSYDAWRTGVAARVKNGWTPVSTWVDDPFIIHVAYVGPPPNAV